MATYVFLDSTEVADENVVFDSYQSALQRLKEHEIEHTVTWVSRYFRGTEKSLEGNCL